LNAELLEPLHLVVVLWGGGDDEAAIFILHAVDAAGDHVFFEADFFENAMTSSFGSSLLNQSACTLVGRVAGMRWCTPRMERCGSVVRMTQWAGSPGLAEGNQSPAKKSSSSLSG
jgi:hypothetical protein